MAIFHNDPDQLKRRFHLISRDRLNKSDSFCHWIPRLNGFVRGPKKRQATTKKAAKTIKARKWFLWLFPLRAASRTGSNLLNGNDEDGKSFLCSRRGSSKHRWTVILMVGIVAHFFCVFLRLLKSEALSLAGHTQTISMINFNDFRFQPSTVRFYGVVLSPQI